MICLELITYIIYILSYITNALKLFLNGTFKHVEEVPEKISEDQVL